LSLCLQTWQAASQKFIMHLQIALSFWQYLFPASRGIPNQSFTKLASFNSLPVIKKIINLLVGERAAFFDLESGLHFFKGALQILPSMGG
jgi:hypothetical protein